MVPTDESGSPPTPVTPVRWPHPFALPDPPLANELVRLRPWRQADAPLLAEAWEDPTIAAHTAVPPDSSPAYAGRWIAGDPARRNAGLCIDLVIEHNRAPAHPTGNDGTPSPMVGEVGLVPVAGGALEVGYWIRSSVAGQGYATAAVRLFVDWVHGQFDALVFADIGPDNPASIAVAVRAGFVAERTDPRCWQYRPGSG